MPTRYRKLYLYLDFDLATMPEFMYNHYRNTAGLKIKDKGCAEDPDVCGEHFDFILENINKMIKQNLDGAPTNNAWLTACRTHDLTQSIKNNFSKHFKLSRYKISPFSMSCS